MKTFDQTLDWCENISETEASIRNYGEQGYELVSMIIDPTTQFIVIAFKKESNMNIKIWIKTTDLGDGSTSSKLFPTEAEARKGLDSEGFEEGANVPCEIESTVLSNADLCEIIK